MIRWAWVQSIRKRLFSWMRKMFYEMSDKRAEQFNECLKWIKQRRGNIIEQKCHLSENLNINDVHECDDHPTHHYLWRPNEHNSHRCIKSSYQMWKIYHVGEWNNCFEKFLNTFHFGSFGFSKVSKSLFIRWHYLLRLWRTLFSHYLLWMVAHEKHVIHSLIVLPENEISWTWINENIQLCHKDSIDKLIKMFSIGTSV